jgi:uncharacterized protein YdeI (YjbR/CyaY-like superfamily)
MEMSKTLYVSTREEWRAWLARHHESETEVWLIYYKKESDRPRIPYDDAVEEALCFGWVDSLVQRIDDEKYAQKYSPRRARSKWSPSNLRRMRKLIENGRMTEFGLAKFDLSLLDQEVPAKTRTPDPEVPPFLRQALEAVPAAWKNFQALAPSYRKNYVGWILAAKKDETRQRRVLEAVTLLEQNKKLGMK